MTLHTKTSGLRPVRVQLVPALTYVMRTTADPASLIARIRAAAAAIDPDVPIAVISYSTRKWQVTARRNRAPKGGYSEVVRSAFAGFACFGGTDSACQKLAVNGRKASTGSG